jgi:hypothetical protein
MPEHMFLGEKIPMFDVNIEAAHALVKVIEAGYNIRKGHTSALE